MKSSIDLNEIFRGQKNSTTQRVRDFSLVYFIFFVPVVILNSNSLESRHNSLNDPIEQFKFKLWSTCNTMLAALSINYSQIQYVA